MSIVEPLELAELNAASIAVVNELAGVHRTLAVNLSGIPATLRFVASGVRAGSSPTAVSAAAFTLGSHPLWLAMLDWNALPPVAALLDGEQLESLPAQIAAALLSAALEPYLDQLAGVTSGRATLDRLEALEAAPPLVAVGLELTPEGGAPMRATLYGDVPALEFVHDIVSRAAPEPLRDQQNVTLSAGVEIGLTQMGFADLRQLRSGDVVLLDVATAQDHPVGLLRFAPQAGWRAKIQPGQVTLIESVKLAHWGRDPAGATVALVFAQGCVELPAVELAQLQPGATLPVSDGEQVTICSGEQLVGRGELVFLGARTGVRLSEWGR